MGVRDSHMGLRIRFARIISTDFGVEGSMITSQDLWALRSITSSGMPHLGASTLLEMLRKFFCHTDGANLNATFYESLKS